MAILVAVFSLKGEHPTARLARCSMGFIVAIVWIMAIADEVVEVLQTFGLVFGLSDAIIGLTIFAMGNSLADLVANMSVAVSSDSISYDNSHSKSYRFSRRSWGSPRVSEDLC